MRPRGESISSPHSRYVGQVGRQKPQCTQSAISSGSGGCCVSNAGKTPAGWVAAAWAVVTAALAAGCVSSCVLMASDSSHEAAGIEGGVGIELLLHPAHHVQRGDWPPDVQLAQQLQRRVLYDQAAAPGMRRRA